MKKVSKSVYMRRRAAVLISVILISFIFISATNVFCSAPKVYKTVLVQSGDCLWDIASRYSDNERDLRDVIAEITEVNSIKGDFIYPGMKLKIPQ